MPPGERRTRSDRRFKRVGTVRKVPFGFVTLKTTVLTLPVELLIFTLLMAPPRVSNLSRRCIRIFLFFPLREPPESLQIPRRHAPLREPFSFEPTRPPCLTRRSATAGGTGKQQIRSRARKRWRNLKLISLAHYKCFPNKNNPEVPCCLR